MDEGPGAPARVAVLALLLTLFSLPGRGQVDSVVIPEPALADLQFLIVEAMLQNREIQSATAELDVAQSSADRAGTLDPPVFRYMREEMPSFRWSEAMYSRFELMQMFPFPTKLSTEREIGTFRAEHAAHELAEVVNVVVARLKEAYAELWFVQQKRVLVREGIRLINGIESAALSRYRSGSAPQSDVLKAQMELARRENELVFIRQEELRAKAELMAILNRSAADTIGYATVSEEVVFDASLDTLEAVALRQRPMLVHDSLNVVEQEKERSLARQGYLPDLNLGLQYVTSPATDFTGWGISAGVTLPFAPWALGRTGAEVAGADARVVSARARYQASGAMVVATVRSRYYEASARSEALETYRRRILPQAEQVLAGLTGAYEAGKTDILMVLDAYMKRLEAVTEYFQLRLEFERAVAQLELAVGLQGAGTRR